MARLRTIKPGFFLDEELADCQPLARLLFAGLWTIADREGRLEDRPKRIKVECLPYDECDVEVLLGELEAHRFIVRYESDGAFCIAIPKFVSHQNPHISEKPSLLPSPPLYSTSTVQAQREHPSYLSLGSCPIEEPLSDSGASDTSVLESFDHFWSTYPRKEGSKKKALVTWKRLSKKKQKLAQGVADQMAEQFAKGVAPERRYMPLATTYLNGETWDGWAEGIPSNWAGEGQNGKKDSKPPICGVCRRDHFSDTPLTVDEEGSLRCPICGWRPSAMPV